MRQTTFDGSSRSSVKAYVKNPLLLSGLKVLLIDDSNVTRLSCEMFLSHTGCQVVLAEDGFDGLSKVIDHCPDLIFMDVMMPRLDGYASCSMIKKNADYRNIPVVMLTSKDSVFDRARGMLAGADHYLTKPFNKMSMISAIIKHTSVKREATTSTMI